MRPRRQDQGVDRDLSPHARFQVRFGSDVIAPEQDDGQGQGTGKHKAEEPTSA